MNIEELVQMSRKYGADQELVLAGGGNTSQKDGTSMFVKASGTSLAAITADGFVEMSMCALEKIIKKEYPADDIERERLALCDMMEARVHEGKRPSVEALLHSLFVQKYVVHLHPTLVNGMTCARDGDKIARELFGENIIWIPPCKPGLVLAKLCAQKLSEYKKQCGYDAQIIFLQNHGVFFASETEDGIDTLLNNTLDRLRTKVRQLPSEDIQKTDADELSQVRHEICAAMGENTVVLADETVDAHSFTSCESRMLLLMKPLTPDHIVYCRAYACIIDGIGDIKNAVERYKKKYCGMPRIVIIKGVGIFACEQTQKDAERAQLLFMDAVKIAIYAESFGGISPMPEELAAFITNWEVESYRKKQN